MRIVFLGTPEFAVAALDILVKNNYNIVGVITAPDKPAGRGRQIQKSAVKIYAEEKGLKILQPEKLKNEDFLSELKSLNADLQIIVAFRMLPEVVWNMPPKGTVNLHASLLPNYRGAAPINWSIINGEKETGVSTFLLQHQIDTGNIIYSEKVPISETTNAGELHDALMEVGAKLILKTVQDIESNSYPQIPQAHIPEDQLKFAPKIFKETCKINWNNSCDSIYNLIRGLSPYPAAYTDISGITEQPVQLKIYVSECQIVEKENRKETGTIICDNKNTLKIACSDGFIVVKELQLAGKKRMNTEEFLRGFKFSEQNKAL